MSRVDHALVDFSEGFVCSQAVLAAFAPELGLERDQALLVSTAFGGGMARRGQTCGAVIGAMMVIGMKRGSTDPADEEARERTYEATDDFVKRFEERVGSIECKELLGCDLSSKEGYARAREEELFVNRCPLFVTAAVEILEQLL